MIPTWEEASKKVDDEKADPIDIFIYNHEPAGKAEEEKFRKELETLIEYVEACK